jgi:hypothetical protein
MTGQKNNNDKKEVCEMWERILRGMSSKERKKEVEGTVLMKWRQRKSKWNKQKQTQNGQREMKNLRMTKT